MDDALCNADVECSGNGLNDDYPALIPLENGSVPLSGSDEVEEGVNIGSNLVDADMIFNSSHDSDEFVGL